MVVGTILLTFQVKGSMFIQWSKAIHVFLIILKPSEALIRNLWRFCDCQILPITKEGTLEWNKSQYVSCEQECYYMITLRDKNDLLNSHMFGKSSSSRSLPLHFMSRKNLTCQDISHSVLHFKSIQLHTAVGLLENRIHHWLIGWLNHLGVVYEWWDSVLPPECRAAYEPRKKPSYFPL